MKVKHIKHTRTALREFMIRVEAFDPLDTVNMALTASCAWAIVTGSAWELSAIADYFKLRKLEVQLQVLVENLFETNADNFADSTEVTWEEWLAAAKVVEAKLTLEIKKLKLEKMKKKYAK